MRRKRNWHMQFARRINKARQKPEAYFTLSGKRAHRMPGLGSDMGVSPAQAFSRREKDLGSAYESSPL